MTGIDPIGPGLALFQLLFCLFFFVFGVLGTAFWIWMLIDCATKEPDVGNNKVIWILIIVLTHWIGAAIYYFVRRPQRRTEIGR